MTRRLIIMRHAKSSWSTPGLADHDRPLNGRGQRSARALGDWLRDKGFLPDEAVVSSSLRTVQTFEGLNLDVQAQFTPEFYHAGPLTFAERLKSTTGRSVLFIAHNPGIAEFAHMMTQVPPDHPRFDDYPTGATTVLEFAPNARGEVAFDWNTGIVVDFIVPRQLLVE